MPVYANLNSFNGGEYSPRLKGRIDISQYSRGCSRLENFLVTPYGAVERRPGTRYLCDAKFSSGKVRLIRFVVSSNVSYVCEFGDGYVRFLMDGVPVLRDGNILELITPYAENDVSEIQYVQSADVMTLVHPNYPVMELKRTEFDLFTITPKEFEYPPMMEPNLDDMHTITPSGVTGDITLEASKDTFEQSNVGGYFQIIHTSKSNQIDILFKSKFITETVSVRFGKGTRTKTRNVGQEYTEFTSNPMNVYGYWTFVSHGTWGGNLKIQRSTDNGLNWSDYRVYSSNNDYNVSTSGEEEDEGVLYRIRMENYVQATTGTLKGCQCLLVNPDFLSTGVVKINAVTDARHASGTVVKQLGANAETYEWNEGAWSQRRGYPRTIAFYEERMMFGGTYSRPQTVWGSKTNDWDNFFLGTKADDGLEFTLASDTLNTISWMCQHNVLVIGTMDSEWTLSASDSSEALTPTNFHVQRQSVFGASGKSAHMVGDVILFVQRGERKIREFVYQWEKNGYASPDLTLLADHITETGITETALQILPDTILWCLLGNGTVAALTYERDQQVLGWHRHITDGFITSLCVVPSGNEDRIYLAVERNGMMVIEEMASRNNTSIESSFYLDSFVEYNSNQAAVFFDGLFHLEGKVVSILADGAVQNPKMVTNGSVLLDSPASHVIIGLPYASVLSPMPVELETQTGQTVLRKKTVSELRIRVYSSVGGKVKCGGDSWQKIISRDVVEDRMDTAISCKDEVVLLNMLGGAEYSTSIEIMQEEPLPLNITSIVSTFDVTEK